MDVRDVAKALGRAEIAARLGVKPNAVGEAVRSGRFPAAWFVALRSLGEERGVPISEDLFRWKEAA